MNYKYKGEHLAFNKGREIGKGGNGKVYEIYCDREGFKLVAKFLKLGSKNFNKRYLRFKLEIGFMANEGSTIDGVLPAIDFKLPDIPSSKARPWYVMPYADSFKDMISNSYINIKDKMRYMLDIANIIKRLHNKGYSHRDIKPSNILIYNDSLVLADYGLLGHIDRKAITGTNEWVGAKNTIAPEMMNGIGRAKDCRPADIYSFGKLVWIIITGKTNGFAGSYSIDTHNALNRDDYDVATLEDIHSLLKSCTEVNPNRRPSITYCINKIEHWFNVLEDGELLHLDLKKIAKREISRISKNVKKVLDSFVDIHMCLVKHINLFKIHSLEYGTILVESCYESSTKGCLEFSDGLNKYILKPKCLTIHFKEGEIHKMVLELDDLDNFNVLSNECNVYKAEELSFIDKLSNELMIVLDSELIFEF